MRIRRRVEYEGRLQTMFPKRETYTLNYECKNCGDTEKKLTRGLEPKKFMCDCGIWYWHFNSPVSKVKPVQRTSETR